MVTENERIINIPCPAGKQVYFASDFHLGAPDYATSFQREQRIVRWLRAIAPSAAHVFLVGDLFDFWFEYKAVIPKGYTRLLGTLAEMSDQGIGLSVFTGNHDMWMDGYFEQELHIPVYRSPREFAIGGKRFFIGHGDGLGPGDRRYKLMKKIFQSKVCRSLFAALHPGWGVSLANALSRRSRIMTQENTFLGEDREWLVQYAKERLKEGHVDYFVFGHRHLPIDIPLPGNSRYINLGDWLRYYSYAVFDGREARLCYFEQHIAEGRPA